MDSAVLAALSALGGALIGSVSSFAASWLAQRSESRRALRAELISAALAHWDKRLEYSYKITHEPVLPAQDFVVDFLYLERLIDRGIAASSVPEIIEELRRQQELYQAIVSFRSHELKNHNHIEEEEDDID